MESTRRIILFDGYCNLCNRSVQFIIRRDPNAKFRFGALTSAAGRQLLQEISLTPEKVNSVIYLRGDKPYLKSSAVIEILHDVGGIWKTSKVAYIIPRFIRDFLYDRIAKFRYRIFGRKSSCMVPDENLRKRFLAEG